MLWKSQFPLSSFSNFLFSNISLPWLHLSLYMLKVFVRKIISLISFLVYLSMFYRFSTNFFQYWFCILIFLNRFIRCIHFLVAFLGYYIYTYIIYTDICAEVYHLSKYTLNFTFLFIFLVSLLSFSLI